MLTNFIDSNLSFSDSKVTTLAPIPSKTTVLVEQAFVTTADYSLFDFNRMQAIGLDF